MLEKRKVYIDQLLRNLRALEERVLAVRENDSLPFSFFRESFDKTQEISRTLHQLEFMQIDDMRQEMERLVHVLSEVENREPERVSEPVVPDPTPEPEPEPVEVASPVHRAFPEYRNPKIAVPEPPVEVSPVAPPRTALVDLKRGLSLNDRFLFQRELFQNNRQAMDGLMGELAALGSYEEAEEYLRESTAWDFESPTVNEFLSFIRQGFA